jgi:hypothetical protein
MQKHLKVAVVFILFFAITVFLYLRTAGAGFVTDEIGWFTTYNEYGWKGLFTAFSDKSFHLVYHIFGFLCWKLFGFNGEYWLVFFSFLHALTATLSFTVFGKLFSHIDKKQSGIVAFFGALLFLVSPYHTEPLVWYACVHYLVCAVLLLSSLGFVIQYIESNSSKFVWLFYSVFTAACFTLELSFAWPIIFALLLVFFPFNNMTASKCIGIFALFVLPALAGVAIYFAVNKIMRGSYVGHYGAATHLNFSIPLLVANLAKYTAKVFVFSQFIPFAKREWLYLFSENDKFAYIVFGVLSTIGVLFVVAHKKLPTVLSVGLLLFALFICSLLPVLNLFFSYIVNVEGDRFTYIAIIFSSQLIAFALFRIGGKIALVPLLILLFLNIKFLNRNVSAWQNSGIIQQRMLGSFAAFDASKIYFLNMPDNFRGAYMFRSFAPDNSFAETLFLKTGNDIESKSEDVLYWNMNELNEGVTVQKKSDSTLVVTFNQWGNWWWLAGKGAVNNASKNYSCNIDEWGHSYEINFTQKEKDAVYLYWSAGEWKSVEGF